MGCKQDYFWQLLLVVEGLRCSGHVASADSPGSFAAHAFTLAAGTPGCKNDGPLSAPLNTASASPAMPSPAGAGTASLAEDVASHEPPTPPNAAPATPAAANTLDSAPAFDAGSPDPVAAAATPKLPAQSPAPAAPPCDMSAALAAHCQPCHGDPPIGGAPMRLASVDDFQRPASSQPKLTVRELALMHQRRGATDASGRCVGCRSTQNLGRLAVEWCACRAADGAHSRL